jgi:hypothetical protein
MRSQGLGGPSGRWVYGGGWFRAWAMVIAPTWIAINIIAGAVERRTIFSHLGEQYKALVFGDSICLPAIAFVVWYLGQAMSERPGWWSEVPWHIVCAAAAMITGICFHWWDTTTHFYTRSQTNSPTKLYHDFILLPWFVYTLVSGGIPALRWSKRGWKWRLLIFAILAAYIWLNYYDSLDRPTHGQINFDWSHFRPG